MKPAPNTKKRHISIRAKIFLSLLCIILIALSLLWLCQVVMYKTVYNNVRINEIRATAKHTLLYCNETSFYAELASAAVKTDVCASVLASDGSVTYSVENSPSCIIHQLKTNERQEILTLVEVDEACMFGVVYNPTTDEYDLSELNVTRFTTADNVVYVERFDHNGEILYLVIDGFISPVNTVTKAAASFLILLTLILLPIAVLIAQIFSRLIATPLSEINRQAGRLSQVDYAPVDSSTTEIAELNESLSRASRDLAQVTHLRQELIANISHDLRTPLTLMSGYLEMMRDFPDEVNEENLKTVIDECNRLSSLVNDMLDISRLENGAVQPAPKRYNLTESLEKTLARYKTFAGIEGYSFSFAASESVTVVADELLITQVFTNLINNALTYTGDDKKVTVTQTVRDGWVRVEVSDTGEGIDPEKLPLIWDRYYKVDAAHKRAAKGTGLGLSIVRSVIQLHKGSYGVRSLPGKGSTFWFELSVENDPASLPTSADTPEVSTGTSAELPDNRKECD